MLIHATRTIAADDIDPGSTITDPDPSGSGLPLYVDAVTRTVDGVEVSCYPPGRASGKRWVRRLDGTASVEEVAGDATREDLLDKLYRAMTNNPAVTIEARQVSGGAILLRWPDGWRLLLQAVETLPLPEPDDDTPLVPDPPTQEDT